MADIGKAYRFLSKAMNLKISNLELKGVEKAFKVEWMKEKQFEKANVSKPDDWEFVAHLEPRKGAKKKKH